MYKCPNCNKELPQDSVFCHYCGCNIREILIAESRCPACGRENEPDSDFCSFCGEKFVLDSGFEVNSKKNGFTKARVKNNKNSIVKRIKNKSKKSKIIIGVVSGAVLALCILALLFGVNCSKAVDALYSGDYENSVKHFDNILVAESLYSQEYICAQLGKYAKEDNYAKISELIDQVSDESLCSVKEDIKEIIYKRGQSYYNSGKYTLACARFELVKDYGKSAKYLRLISMRTGLTYDVDFYDIISLLDFEDTKSVVMDNERLALIFLEGKWTTNGGGYYFRIADQGDNYNSTYNLPEPNASGYFYIDDGVYSVGKTAFNTTKFFRIYIHSRDSIDIYCYKDGCTYSLYRQ